MLKTILLFTAFFAFFGCSTKPTVIQAGPQNRPIVQNKPNYQTQQQNMPKLLNTENQAINPNLGETIEISSDDLLNRSNSKSYVTTFKTKRFSFSDAGFMKQEDGVIDLQILALGKPLLKMKISEDICVDHHCRTKQEFNQNFLSPDYPYDLINHVLSSQPIFGGENLKQTSNGFMQRIKSPLYDIKYKIAPGSIYFKDLQNHIIIKLREL